MSEAPRRDQPQVSSLARFIRWLQLKNYQYEVTMSLYMLTTTEKIVFNSILITLVSLLLTAAYFYLPDHLRVVYTRVWYYISGEFTHGHHVDTGPLVSGVGERLSSLLKATKEVVVSQTASALARDATARVGEAAEMLKDEL